MTQRPLKKNAASRVTQREFIMLAILVLAIEAFVLIRFVVTPQWAAFSDIKSTNDMRQITVEKMKADFASLDTFKATLNQLTQGVTDAKAQIPAYVSQEEVLMLIEEKTQTSGVQVGMINFAPPVAIAAAGLVAASDGTTPAEAAPAVPAVITKESVQEPLLVTQNIAITFDGNFEEIMSFFKAMETNLRKVYLAQVSLTSMDDGTLGGTLNISFVSYIDANNFDQYQLDLKMNSGKSNPFTPYSGFGVKKAVIVPAEPDPNLYIYLNSYLDNAQKVIVGQYKAQGSELNFNENKQTKVKMTLTGNKDAFGYTLTLNGAVLKSKGTVTLENGIIQIKVLSLKRKDAKDLVSIVLDVDNQSSAKAVLTILNDDSVKPRVKKGVISNNVTIK